MHNNIKNNKSHSLSTSGFFKKKNSIEISKPDKNILVKIEEKNIHQGAKKGAFKSFLSMLFGTGKKPSHFANVDSFPKNQQNSQHIHKENNATSTVLFNQLEKPLNTPAYLTQDVKVDVQLNNVQNNIGISKIKTDAEKIVKNLIDTSFNEPFPHMLLGALAYVWGGESNSSACDSFKVEYLAKKDKFIKDHENRTDAKYEFNNAIQTALLTKLPPWLQVNFLTELPDGIRTDLLATLPKEIQNKIQEELHKKIGVINKNSEKQNSVLTYEFKQSQIKKVTENLQGYEILPNITSNLTNKLVDPDNREAILRNLLYSWNGPEIAVSEKFRSDFGEAKINYLTEEPPTSSTFTQPTFEQKQMYFNNAIRTNLVEKLPENMQIEYRNILKEPRYDLRRENVQKLLNGYLTSLTNGKEGENPIIKNKAALQESHTTEQKSIAEKVMVLNGHGGKGSDEPYTLQAGQYVIAPIDLNIPYVLSLGHETGFEHYLKGNKKLPSLKMIITDKETGKQSVQSCTWKVYGPGDSVPDMNFSPWTENEAIKWKDNKDLKEYQKEHGKTPNFLPIAGLKKIKIFGRGKLKKVVSSQGVVIPAICNSRSKWEEISGFNKGKPCNITVVVDDSGPHIPIESLVASKANTLPDASKIVSPQSANVSLPTAAKTVVEEFIKETLSELSPHTILGALAYSWNGKSNSAACTLFANQYTDKKDAFINQYGDDEKTKDDARIEFNNAIRSALLMKLPKKLQEKIQGESPQISIEAKAKFEIDKTKSEYGWKSSFTSEKIGVHQRGCDPLQNVVSRVMDTLKTDTLKSNASQKILRSLLYSWNGPDDKDIAEFISTLKKERDGYINQYVPLPYDEKSPDVIRAKTDFNNILRLALVEKLPEKFQNKYKEITISDYDKKRTEMQKSLEKMINEM
jgi:hypothetical protein